MCTVCMASRAPGVECDYTHAGPAQQILTEVGDAAGSTATTYVMAVSDTFNGALNANGDDDWIRIDLTAGDIVQIDLAATTFFDPYLRLYDSTGTLIAENDDNGVSLNSSLTFQALSSGSYYISARSLGDNETGTYALSVANGSLPPAGTVDELASYLTDGYWSRRSFDTTTDNTLTVNLTALTAAGQQLARWALDMWEGAADLQFVEVIGTADITFDDNQPGAFASSVTSGATIMSSTVNIDVNWLASYGTAMGSYSFQTYLHEIGHALGLGHQGSYNVSATYPTDAVFANDSWQMSVMSYFDQIDNTTVNADLGYLFGPMLADILAIQALYGAPSGTVVSTGNTVYGVGHTLTGALGQLLDAIYVTPNSAVYDGAPLAFTIYDVGGTDTIDYSDDTVAQRVDLTPEAISDVYGRIGNMVIARGTIIENYVAGSGDDSVTGNAANNDLRGGGGNDSLLGGSGNDTLNGGSGGDVLDGGSGTDTVSYEGSTGSLRVDLMFAGINTNVAAGDSYVSIENLIGSQGFDNLRGTTGANRIEGMANVDYVFGRAGNDTLVGGVGDDVLFGGVGADVLDGGANRDRAQYSESLAALLVDLMNPGLNTGEAAGDSYVSIEDLAGSRFDDTLSGDLGDNRLFGREGADRLYGRAGNDYLNGGANNDRLDGGLGDDTLRGGQNADTFVFDAGADRVEDFTAVQNDRIAIDKALIGGSVLTGAEIVASYASVIGGMVVFDFGSGNTLTLETLASTAGLDAYVFAF
ncbi:MAG: M10 family metallopeptidase C-terminal domain-containing protein [Rhodobacteraceae bacterium]|nr:M10 family metallopeptidase C-terminal domain-containing protein [Paracoccaceae bacterium]